MSPETMNFTGSLRKISKELAELDPKNTDPQELEDFLSATSYLLKYMADALDVELQHAAARGRMLAMKRLEEGNVMPSSFPPDNPSD